jgi:tetratricopeptide (TPR) repeat protein
MNNKLNNIFSETDCLSSKTILAYVEGKLSADERYLVERHLTDCELCSDAVEGLSLLKNKSKLPKLFAGINVAIDKKANKKESRVFRFDFRMRLAAAALIIVIFGITFLFKYIFHEQRNNMMAQRMIKESKMTKGEKKAIENKFDSVVNTEQESKNIPGDNPNQSIIIKDAKTNPGTGGESGNGKGKEKDIPLVIIPKAEGSKTTIVTEQQKDVSGFYRNEAEKSEVDSSKVLLEKTDADKNYSNNISFAQDYKSASGESLKKAVTDSISFSSSLADESKAQTQSPVVTYNSNTTNNNVTYANNINKVVAKEEVQTKTKSNNKPEKKSQNQNQTPTSATITTTNLDDLGGTMDNRYSTGVQKYHNNDYIGSKDTLESYLKDNPNDFNALYYCGVSCYFLNQYDSAITYLEKAVKYNASTYLETAQWYLALSYIGKNENKKAVKLLNEIIKANGNFKTQSEQKLLELK